MSLNNEPNNLNDNIELLNYLDRENATVNNISQEKINNSNENNQFSSNLNKIQKQDISSKNKEEILDMELKNIQMLILHRSLYILKNKFEINKKEIEIIYQKYRDDNYMKIKCINVDYLFDLFKEIMDTTQFTMLPYVNFNELISADLMTELNSDKTKAILKALIKFTKINIEKYNRIYFEKKMKKKQMIEENEKKKKIGQAALDFIDYTKSQKIVRINKRGKIIQTFEEMIENNKEIKVDEDIIVKINEDDMSVLNDKKLLYSDVIPLIIADFLQEYLKNDEYVAIISTSNISEDKDNYRLNQNVKSLFDNDIVKFYNNLNKVDPEQENKEKLKNLLFELMNTENQIKIYQKLILEKTAKGANVKHLMNMEKKLNEQKSILQKKINQFNITKNSGQSLGADISLINTNSILGNNITIDKNHLKENYKNIEKNNLLKKNNSNSKNSKNLKIAKNPKYKEGNSPSKFSLDSKRFSTTNNYNSNKIQKNFIAKTNNDVNIKANNNIVLNNNNEINSKYNYYYNNDNFYYQHGIKFPETKEEFRKNSLLDIFYFYTKQHSFLGQTPTFQEILKSEENLDLAEFGKFCVEFKILVKPQKIAEIFKKIAKNSKELNFALFIQTLKRLSICANEEKKQYLMERIKLYKIKFKEIQEKNKKIGIVENENEQNKIKDKEENLSGIKSEGEEEDEEKCQQEKNMENQNQEEDKEINFEKLKEIENIIDKKSNNSKDNDKKSNKNSNEDKKSSNNNVDENMNPASENKEEINKEENVKANSNENKQNLDNISNNINNSKYESLNLKYFKENKIKNQSKNHKTKKLKLAKSKTNNFSMMETKEELEEKISKLQQDYEKLNQKTKEQLEEEFYQYLEIDDINVYRKKMVGYIYPFINRENDSRFPLQSVARPVYRDPKMQKEMHKILVQRHEEMKREKELKQIKEKNILFEKRKKKFEIENKKIQQKMSKKNDYLQIKRNNEDYKKEKMNKLTWQQIQNCDYDTFIINENDKVKGNLDDIFTIKNIQFEGDDSDCLKNFRLKKGFNENIIGNKINNMNLNINSENHNFNNNNSHDNINKTELLPSKFHTNLSRISSGNNVSINSEYDIVNSFESKK